MPYRICYFRCSQFVVVIIIIIIIIVLVFFFHNPPNFWIFAQMTEGRVT